MIVEHADGVVTSEAPTGLVKWFPRSGMQAHDLVLHQQWSVRTYKNSRPEGYRLEWRKVETGSLEELR